MSMGDTNFTGRALARPARIGPAGRTSVRRGGGVQHHVIAAHGLSAKQGAAYGARFHARCQAQMSLIVAGRPRCIGITYQWHRRGDLSQRPGPKRGEQSRDAMSDLQLGARKQSLAAPL